MGEKERAVGRGAIEEATIWGKRNKEGVNKDPHFTVRVLAIRAAKRFDFCCPAKRSISREKVKMAGITVRQKTIFLWGVGWGGAVFLVTVL